MFSRDGAVVAAGIRYNAIGAAVVAALLDLNKGFVAAFKAGDEIMVVLIIVKNIADVRFFGQRRIDKLLDIDFFFIAEDEVDLIHGGKFLRGNLGGAAGDDDFGIGVFFAQFAYGLAALAFGFAGNGASIDDYQVVNMAEFFFQNL